MTLDYTIRKANADDDRNIKAFLVQNKQGPTIAIDDSSTFLVAEADQQVVGVAGAELNSANALVRSTGVLNSWRSNGLASELLCELFWSLKERGVSELFLFSTDAGDFWTKKGFKGCEIRELMEHLPNALQVQTYVNDRSIWSDVAWRRKLADVTSHYELSDDDFENQFSSASLNASLFTHEAHIRLAWLHTKKYGEHQAIENITSQLKRYVDKLGATSKYNEPLTIAAIKCVESLRLKTMQNNFRKFIRANNQLMSNFKATIQPYLK